MRRPRGDDGCVSGAERSALPPEPEPERSRDALEPLELPGVDVYRDESTGSHEQIGGDTIARSLSEHDTLTGDRIFDCVHGSSAQPRRELSTWPLRILAVCVLHLCHFLPGRPATFEPASSL
jgi:hypothetical protein